MIEVGCAWLLRPTSLSSGGWASIGGGDPFKFTDVEYLKSRGALWITQCPPNSFATESGRQYPWLRHSDYLTTPLHFVAEELATAESQFKSAQAVSEILTRVVNLAIEVAPGIQRYLLDPQFSHCTLHELIQLVASPVGRSVDLPDELVAGLPYLFKGYPARDATPYNDILVRVPAARVALSERVLSSFVPGENWREIKQGEFPNPLTWASKGRHSIIANVQIVKRIFSPKEKDVGPRGDLSVFGAMPKGTRRWMASPEIEVMSKLFELKAEKVFHCDEVIPTGATLKIPPPIFSPVARASFSAGLMAEVFMHAAGTGTPVYTAGDDGRQDHSSYSIRSAWVNSRARASMIEAAIELSQNRITVLGAGISHLHVATQKAKLRGLRFAVVKNPRLCYPTGVRAAEEKFKPKSTAQFSYESTSAEQEEP